MNVELKDLLNVAFDGLAAAQDMAAKQYLSILGDMTKLMGDVPASMANFSDLQAEIGQLQNPANQADLIAYIEQKFQGAVSSAKAQNILASALKLVQDLVVVIQDGLSLKSVIQG